MAENTNAQAGIVPGNSYPPLTVRNKRKPGLRGNRNNPNLAELGKPYRWQKGQASPNPSGRPKTPLTDALRDGVAQVDKSDGLSIAEKLAEAQIRQALQGSLPHFHEIRVAIEGPDTHAVQVALDNPYNAEPGEQRQREIAVRVARIMVERSRAFRLPLPEFAQEAVRGMDAETVAEAEQDGIIERSKTRGTPPPEGEEPQRGPVGGADAKTGEDK